MSATQTTEAPAAGSIAAAEPTAAPAAAPSPAPTAPAAEPGTAPADPRDQAAPVSPAERAVRAAKARKAAKDAPTSPPAGEQAAASPDAGASTPANPGDPADPSAPATGEPSDPAPADSIATAPADWPAEFRQRFEALPEDARGMTLDFYKDMQAGFTKAMQKVSQNEQALGKVTQAMQTHGVDAGYVASLMDTAVAFNTDPKATLQRLAGEAGIEVYFEPPPAPGEIPKFETTEEMANWMRQEAERKAREVLTAEREAQDKQRKQEQSEAAFRAELQAAQQLPEFAKYRAATLDKLSQNPALSVEDAYWLTVLPSLREQAGKLPALQKELAALKAKADADAKRATQPVGVNGHGQPSVDESQLTPAMRAMRRARQKLAARQTGARA